MSRPRRSFERSNFTRLLAIRHQYINAYRLTTEEAESVCKQMIQQIDAWLEPLIADGTLALDRVGDGFFMVGEKGSQDALYLRFEDSITQNIPFLHLMLGLRPIPSRVLEHTICCFFDARSKQWLEYKREEGEGYKVFDEAAFFPMLLRLFSTHPTTDLFINT